MKPIVDTCTFQIWSPKQPTADNVTRLAITPLRATDKLTSPVEAVVTTDGKSHHRIVPGEHIAAFLKQHSTVPIVFENAGEDFSAIHRHLRRHDTVAAARAWRKRIDTGKFSSVLLLDQLVRLSTAEHGTDEAIPPRTFNEIAGDLEIDTAVVELPTERKLADLGSTSRLRAAAEKSVLLMHAYNRLRRKARAIAQRVIDEEDVLDDLVERFGWLTEHLQAAAEISLARMSRRGVHVDQTRCQKLHADLHVAQLRWAEQLNHHAPGLLRQTGGEFQFTPTGKIGRSDRQLDQYLRRAFEESSSNWPDAKLPRTEKGNISRSSSKWQPFARENAFLKAWIGLERVQYQLQFVRQFNEAHLQPNYTTLVRSGRTSCANPPLQGLPRKGGIRELIVPREGYAFLTIDVNCFELVTLGAICRHRFGHSKLAEVLEAGRDPHIWTAAMLVGQSYDELLALQKTHPQRFHRLREQAKPINFGVPGGLTADTLVDYARDVYGVELSLPKAKAFRVNLITEVYPELQEFLRDDGDTAVTLTGRVRGGVTFTQCHNSQFQGLAADAAKRALVGLVAGGFRVVLFAHDEYVIEIPSEGGTVARKTVDSILTLIKASMHDLLGLNVSCTYTVADRWSKHAKRIPRVGSRIPVWTPDC